jgi:threonine/homoserine/homoserine lactone efflux protein
MVGDPEPEVGVTAVVTLRAGLAAGFRRAWGTEKGRRRIVVSAGVVISVICIAVAVSLFASLAGESQAFRDGYSAGGSAYTAYAAYSDTNITSDQSCRDEETGPGGRPAHDDAAQWIQGCVAAFNLAQSDN